MSCAQDREEQTLGKRMNVNCEAADKRDSYAVSGGVVKVHQKMETWRKACPFLASEARRGPSQWRTQDPRLSKDIYNGICLLNLQQNILVEGDTGLPSNGRSSCDGLTSPVSPEGR